MGRLWIVIAVAMGGLVLSSIAAEKDTPAAANMRAKKLKTIVTLDVKDQPLKEILKDLSEQLETAGAGSLSVKFGIGVSQNQRLTLKVDKMSLEAVLEMLLMPNKLGYIVISTKEPAQLRYDGWLEIRVGNERGSPAEDEKTAKKGTPKVEPKKEDPKVVVKAEPKEEPKEEPKVEPKAIVIDKKQKLEDGATLLFELAQTYIDGGKNDKARAKLMEIIKLFPTTDVATEAANLLKELK